MVVGAEGPEGFSVQPAQSAQTSSAAAAAARAGGVVVESLVTRSLLLDRALELTGRDHSNLPESARGVNAGH